MLTTRTLIPSSASLRGCQHERHLGPTGNQHVPAARMLVAGKNVGALHHSIRSGEPATVNDRRSWRLSTSIVGPCLRVSEPARQRNLADLWPDYTSCRYCA